MAITENGPQGAHRGKIGNLVYYILNGQQVARKNGRKTKPPTEAQLAHQAKVKLVNTFLKTIKDFIHVGFSIERLGTTKNAFNLAVEHNFHKIVSGTYPDLDLDYSKLLVSIGKLKPAQNPTVANDTEGLRFNWDTNPQMPFLEATDQVMMLAYFPVQRKSVCTLFGKDRLSGTDLLYLPEDFRAEYAETYIAFISSDRKQLSDSFYLGPLNT